MAEVGSVWVGLNVDVSGVGRFSNAASVIGRDSARMRAGLAGTTRSIASLQNQMGRTQRIRLFGDSIRTISRTTDELSRMRAALVGISALTGTGLTGALSATYLLQTADRARLLSNQLKTVTKDSADLTATQEQLYQMSQRTRSGFDATTKIYARTARATEHLGLSQEKLLKITETVQKAFAIGGATQQEAMGAAIQLSQGIASDRFSGEEFRSVAENAPVLLRGIADSLGVNIGKLREMAHAGELTAKVVTEAILKSAGDIDAAFDKTTATVGQAITRLDNAFLMYIGQADESYGVTRRLSNAISGLAENFEEVAKWSGAAMLGGAAILGGRAASSAIGGRIQSFTEIRAARQAELDGLREQSREMVKQGDLLQRNIAAEQIKANRAHDAAIAQTATTKQVNAALKAQDNAYARVLAHQRASVALGEAQVRVANQIAVAQRRATGAAALGAMARNAGAGVLGFFGGWTGVAITAAIAGLLLWQRQSLKAAEDTERLIQKLRDLGYVSVEAGNDMESLADKIEKGRWAALRKDIGETTVQLSKWQQQMRGIDLSGTFERQSLGAEFGDIDVPTDLTRKVEKLRDDFLAGRINVEQFNAGLDEMVRKDGLLAGIATQFQTIAENIAGASGYLRDLNKGLDEAGRKPSFRAAESGSMEALGAMRGENSAFFADRMTEAQRTEFQTEVDKRAEEILKAAEKLGRAITQGEAAVQARDEILAERGASSLGSAVDGFVDRVVKVESGGNRFAKNPDSSATGVGQFIESTWINLFKKHFPDRAEGMSRQAMLALRTDAAISRRLIEEYARENAVVLQKAGVSVDEAALQLAHFLGAGDAAKVLNAAPGTPLAGLISSKSIAANPTILGGGKTVEDAVAYAQRRAGMTTELTKEIDLREQQNLTIQQTIESLRQQAEMYGLEAATMNMSLYDRERLIKALELEQNLKSQGIAITPQLTAMINAEADAYARKAIEAEKAAGANRHLAEEMNFTRDIVGGALTDLREALKDGKLEWQELGDIAISVLGKIADRLQDQFLDFLFPSTSRGGGGFGLFGGGFKGLLGGILIPGILHRGGDADRPNSHRNINVVPRFHEGRLRHNELLSILEDTENVLTQEQTGRIGNTLEQAAKGGGGNKVLSIAMPVTFQGAYTAKELMDYAAAMAGRAVDEVKARMPEWNIAYSRDGAIP